MEPGEPGLDPCYSDPCSSEDGVDLTLIRWMLSLTPIYARPRLSPAGRLNFFDELRRRAPVGAK